MLLDHPLYIWPLLASAAFAVVLAIYGWRRRTLPGAIPFIVLMLAGALWALGDMLMLTSIDFQAKVFWLSLMGVAQILAATAQFCFGIDYVGLGNWLNRFTLSLLALPLLFTAFILLTDSYYHLAYAVTWLDGPAVEIVRGPGALALTGYGFLLLIVETILLFHLAIRSPLHRWPVGLIIGVGGIPLVLYFLHGIWNINLVAPLDPVILFQNFTNIAYLLALFRLNLFDWAPPPREMILAHIDEGMVVLDGSGRIVEVNPMSARLLGFDLKKAAGRAAAEVLPKWANWDSLLQSPDPVDTEVVTGMGADQVHYRVHVSPLPQQHGRLASHLILLYDVTQTRRAEILLVEQQRALAALEERARIARELHDDLGQVLAYAHVQAEAARSQLARREMMTADASLAQLVSVLQDAHVDVREYILGAGTSNEPYSGLATTLSNYLERFSENYGIECELRLPEGLRDGALSPTAEIQLLRIIQEALTNVRKHASARHVQVDFRVQDGEVRVTVRDDGNGFDPEKRDGHAATFGLRLMRERAKELGGGVEFLSAQGAGTQVIIQVPWEKELA